MLACGLVLGGADACQLLPQEFAFRVFYYRGFLNLLDQLELTLSNQPKLATKAILPSHNSASCNRFLLRRVQQLHQQRLSPQSEKSRRLEPLNLLINHVLLDIVQVFAVVCVSNRRQHAFVQGLDSSRPF